MLAAPVSAALPNNPDPPLGQGTVDRGGSAQSHPAPAHSQAVPEQSHAGRVLALLRKLIAYGQDLARTVQERTAATALFTVAAHFGTRDFALILARITRGLRLAHALQARLAIRPVRDAQEDVVPAPVHARADRARRTARPSVPRPALSDVPTAEEIAAALRGRPAAAVIADICRDLGLVPAHPLWREVMLVLAGPGGGFSKFFKDMVERVVRRLTAPQADDAEEWPAPPWHPVAPCGTGPP